MLSRSQGGARMHRRKQMSLEIVSALETQELENKVATISILDMLWPYLPLIAWATWLFLGTLFYVHNNNYNWSKSFYMCVNIGVGMNWPLPSDITEEEYYQKYGFKLYSSFHTAIGAIFLGSSTLYISTFAEASTSVTWFKKNDIQDITNPLRRWGAVLHSRLPHYKIVTFSIAWIALGIIWFTCLEDNWGVLDSLDYVASSVTGAGYKGISNDSPDYQFVFAALYAAIGVPLTAITIGVSVSSYFEPSDEEKVTKLFADITQQELDFMVEYGLDDGDGMVDKEEFVILMVVRIGMATPELIARLNDRFRELNRKNDTDRIHYDDIVAGRRKITPEMRKLMFANRGLSSMNLSSFADAAMFENKVHPAELGRSLSSSSDTSQHHINRQNSESAKWSHKIRKRAASSEKAARVDSLESVDSPTYSPLNSDEPTVEGKVPTRMKSFSIASLASGSSANVGNYDDKNSPQNDTADDRHISRSKVDMISAAVSTDMSDDIPEYTRQGATWEGPRLAIGECDQLSELDTDDFESYEVGTTLETRALDGSGLTLKPSASKNAVPLQLLMQRLRKNSSSPALTGPSVLPRADSRVAPTPIINTSTYTENSGRRSSVQIEIMGHVVLTLRHNRYIALYNLISHPHVRIFLAWVIWLAVGTIFYHFVNGIYDGNSLVRAFFTSVSVGLSMFWVSVPNTPGVTAYTICHMLFGAVALGSVRAAVAHALAQSKLNWYVDAMRRKEALSGKHENVWENIWALLKYYGPKARLHVLMWAFIFFGIALTCGGIGWTFLNGLYFSVSALTTGGLFPLPEDTGNWLYVLVGIMVSFGAPVVAVSVSLLAASIANIGELDNLQKVVNTVITEEELQVMNSLGFYKNDQYMDRNEFILLMLIRIGALNTDLMTIIIEWFNSMDTEQAGLSYEKITHTHMQASTPMKKRARTVFGVKGRNTTSSNPRGNQDEPVGSRSHCTTRLLTNPRPLGYTIRNTL